jgi:hypothetical protein
MNRDLNADWCTIFAAYIARVAVQAERPNETAAYVKKLIATFYAADPHAQLYAMRSALEHVRLYHSQNVLLEVSRVLDGLDTLLLDMMNHASNPLIAYAATPGRKGKRREPQAIHTARFLIGCAAQWQFNEITLRPPNGTPPTVIAACTQVLRMLDDHLAQYNLTLESILGGTWRTDTPERHEQARPVRSRSQMMAKRIESMRRHACKSIGEETIASMKLHFASFPPKVARQLVEEVFIRGALERLLAHVQASGGPSDRG